MAKPLKKLKRQLRRNRVPKWPKADPGNVAPPIMLLLLSPPNSGSTAIADFVCQLPEISGLTRRYEGQWLLRGLVARRRWTEELEIDTDAIRSMWLSRVKELRESGQRVEYVIEKSPPNMMRHREISGLFPDCRLVCNNRNPYANVASMAFRYGRYAASETRTKHKRLKKISNSWLKRARKIREIVEAEACPLLTYEQFCEDPQQIFRDFGLSEDMLARVSLDKGVKVKDHEIQPITNMNQRQVARFGEEELSAIHDVIAPHGDLLAFFGYDDDPANA